MFRSLLLIFVFLSGFQAAASECPTAVQVEFGRAEFARPLPDREYDRHVTVFHRAGILLFVRFYGLFGGRL